MSSSLVSSTPSDIGFGEGMSKSSVTVLSGQAAPLETRDVTTSDGVVLATQRWSEGKGGDIILVHGYAQCHLAWARQFTGPLVDRYRILTFDLRGHGASGQPADPAAYRQPDLWAEDLRVVRESWDARRPLLVAWSYAGRVVLDHISRFGTDELAGLMMVAATCTGDASCRGEAATLLAGLAADGSASERIANTAAFLAACTVAPVDQGDLTVMLAYNMMVPLGVRKALGGRPAEYDETLARLDIPVVGVHGEGDRINAPEMTRYLQRICPSAQMLFYQNSGHMPFWEEPERFNRDLAEFADRCLSGRQPNPRQQAQDTS